MGTAYSDKLSDDDLDISQDPLPHRDASKAIDTEANLDSLGVHGLSEGKREDHDHDHDDLSRDVKGHGDLERGGSDGRGSTDKIFLEDRRSEVEITPVEAFRVSVAGDQSPFPEVAACVPNTDDPTALVNTLRSWFLLTIFVILFAGVNLFFSLRYPSLTLGYVVAQVLVHPIGLAWGKLPRFKVPLGRWSFYINPGPWSIKEHAHCLNLTAAQPYAVGSLVAITNPNYWNRNFGPGFTFCYLLTTQMLGFGLAGLARRWLVYPAALIWPSSLASTVLFRALHEPQDKTPVNGWTVTRYKYFVLLAAGAFVLFWIPDYLWTTTSAFAFATWIAPNNQKVNTVFGMNSGLGLIPLSIDWTQINYAGFPLTTPFWVTCNAFAVIVIFYLFLSPILYYSNVWHSAQLPLLSSSTFDRFGAKYNITRVLDTAGEFSLDNYRQYSPMYISMSYSLSYGLSFAAVTAMVVHTWLYSRHEIWNRLKNAHHGGDDIHMRLMRRSYAEVPDWWYLVLTIIITGLGILTTLYWDMQLPVWGFIVLCLGWGVFLLIPEGLLEGTTNQRIFLNIITELCAGYAFPGKPLANMAVKMYGYNAVKHGMDWSQDMKLSVYMKIPPRSLFWAQLYSSILATAVQTGVYEWMKGNIHDLCSPTQPDRFTCAGSKVVYQASLIWGTIGPQRMFERGQTYTGLMQFFWIGPVVTVLVWLAYRRFPRSLLRFINVPIFFNAAGNIPPANTTQYSLWFIFGFIFNFLIRRRAIGWWKKYNYITQAGMDTGTALATIIIFFCLSYTGVKLVWWGNTVGSNTMDSKGTPWLTVPQGSYFGRGPGDF